MPTCLAFHELIAHKDNADATFIQTAVSATDAIPRTFCLTHQSRIDMCH